MRGWQPWFAVHLGGTTPLRVFVRFNVLRAQPVLSFRPDFPVSNHRATKEYSGVETTPPIPNEGAGGSRTLPPFVCKDFGSNSYILGHVHTQYILPHLFKIA